MLELSEVHTYYGECHVLHGISLSVPEGAVVTLLGRLGMGKTTILRSIIGFTPPRSGAIRFKGEEIQRKPSFQIAKMGIALVPQGRRIFSSLSVRENLTMAAKNKPRADAWTLQRVYSLFPILRKRENHKGNLLSGGEQQMLAIGRALMTNPDLILMDEPSEGLAPLIVKELGSIIRELHQSGIAILLVEQNLSLALAVANFVYLIDQGKIAHKCTPEELACDVEKQMKYLGVTSK